MFAELPERMAVKVLPRPVVRTPEEHRVKEDEIAKEMSYMKRFEAVGLRVYFVSVGPDLVSIAMELAGGRLPVKQSFAEYPLERRIKDLACVARKIACLERSGVVHCDIKVENILMTSSGEPALADFGAAQCRGKGAPRRGTPGHVAPESWEGLYVSDVWALGIVSYQAVFEGREPTAAEEAARGDFHGAWLRPREDLRFRAAQEVAALRLPEPDLQQCRRAWVRELLALLEAMLEPDWKQRITAGEVACRLHVLGSNMGHLESSELEALVCEAIRETEKQVGPCNKIF